MFISYEYWIILTYKSSSYAYSSGDLISALADMIRRFHEKGHQTC